MTREKDVRRVGWDGGSGIARMLEPMGIQRSMWSHLLSGALLAEVVLVLEQFSFWYIVQILWKSDFS